MSDETRTDEILWNRPNPTRKVNTRLVSALTLWCSACGKKRFVDFGKGVLVRRSEAAAEAHEKGISCSCGGVLIDVEKVHLAFGWTKKPIIESVGGFNPAVDTKKFGTIRPQEDHREKRSKKLYFY